MPDTDAAPALPDDVASLKAMVVAQTAELAEIRAQRQAQEAELAAARAGLIEQRFEIEALKSRLARLQRMTFGRSSEKLRDQVEQLELTLADLKAMLPTALTKDFQCVTGWRVHDVAWRGVRLRDLLDRVGADPAAGGVQFGSFDGVYTESLTMDQARRDDVLVAYELEGKRISSAHGGPARLYVAPMYGYKSLKWLDSIEVVRKPRAGYWEDRGYDVDAWIGKSNGRDDQAV